MKVLRSFFPEMKRKFFWFSDVEQKTFGLLAKVSSRLVKSVIYVSTKTFRWLFFWKKLHFFSSFSDFNCWKLSIFLWKLLGKLFKTSIWLSRGTFWGKRFFKNKNVSHSLTLSENFTEVWPKKLNQGCQNCILCLQRNVSMSFFREKFSPHHSRFLFAKKYTTFGRKFMAFVLAMQSACPGEHFEGKQNFEKNKTFHLFRALRGKISNCRQTKVSRVFKIALYVSRWTFRGIFSWHKINIFPLSLPDFEQTTMGLLRKKISVVFKTAFTSAAKRLEVFLGKSSFLFITFGLYLQRNIELLAANMRLACQKRSVGVQGNIWKNIFFWKKCIYVLTDGFWIPADFFQKLGENVSAWLIRLQFTCPGE